MVSNPFLGGAVAPAAGARTHDGVEIPRGGNPPIYGQDIGYHFSIFVEERTQMELQEGMERMAEDEPTRDWD